MVVVVVSGHPPQTCVWRIVCVARNTGKITIITHCHHTRKLAGAHAASAVYWITTIIIATTAKYIYAATTTPTIAVRIPKKGVTLLRRHRRLRPQRRRRHHHRRFGIVKPANTRASGWFSSTQQLIQLRFACAYWRLAELSLQQQRPSTNSLADSRESRTACATRRESMPSVHTSRTPELRMNA